MQQMGKLWTQHLGPSDSNHSQPTRSHVQNFWTQHFGHSPSPSQRLEQKLCLSPRLWVLLAGLWRGRLEAPISRLITPLKQGYKLLATCLVTFPPTAENADGDRLS
jgi:hypothetical protein